MNQNQQNQNESQALPSEAMVAKIAFIGSAITTFGDALSALASLLAYEIAAKSDDGSDSQDQLQQLHLMQKQMDELTAEIEKIKASIKS